jgi:hypothetical protein
MLRLCFFGARVPSVPHRSIRSELVEKKAVFVLLYKPNELTSSGNQGAIHFEVCSTNSSSMITIA